MSAAAVIFIAFALAVLTIAGLVFRRILLDQRIARERATCPETVAESGAPKPRLMTSLMSTLMFGLGPGLFFLIGYLAAPVPADRKIFVATAVFMVAATALMVVYRFSRRKLSPLPWTTALVVVMGGLTLWFRDETFIKVRPTIQFSTASAITAMAAVTGRPRVADLDRLDEVGQRKLKFMVIEFGLGAAAANELVWRNSSTLFWIGYQIWGPWVIFALFAAVFVRMTSGHLTGTCRVSTAE